MLQINFYSGKELTRMLRKTILPFLIIIITIGFIFPFSAFAQDDHVGYSVQAHLPDNQLDESHTYFDLQMEPEQKQQLSVIIYNNEKEDITVRTAVHNASTNSNGLVVYEEREEMDPSLEVPLTDILTLEADEVVVPAGKSKTVTADLEMPEGEYDGIMLGGFHFEKVMNEEESAEGVSLQNKYAYVIGVQLTETDNEVLPDLHLKSIQPKLVNHRTAVVANIQNSEPVLVKDMTVDAAIYKKGEKEPLKEKRQKQINMAPNSNMNYTIDWENEVLKPGDYILKMKVKHDSETWEWEESFVIEKDDATALNRDAVELDDDKVNKWFVTGIVILIIIIAALLFYIWKLKRKQDKKEDLDDNDNVTREG